MKIIMTIVSLALLTNDMYAQDIASANRDDSHSIREMIETMEESPKKPISKVNTLQQMFADGKISGQIRSVYAGYDYTTSQTKDTYATALGGQLKYELAELDGFNAAAAFYTAQDINFATGDRSKGEQNNEFSSSKGNYTNLAEAYVNYKNNGFNFRGGRQVIDTPLANSDDIRIIQNTFDAYIATYEQAGFTFTAGNLQKWQGYDAGLDNGWQNTGINGTWIGSISFSNDILDASVWYYNISEFSNIFYTDGSLHYNLNKDIFLHVSAQYISENELNDSTINADIYGVMAEIVLHGFGISMAYDYASVASGKQTFSGFGGGALYTNMDTMILNNIASDRDADSIVGNMSYKIHDFKIWYAYGNFKGNKNSLNQKAHIVEQNIGFEYNVINNFKFSSIYVVNNDKENPNNSQTNWNRLQFMATYNF
ncbi:MAG: hypothetical protein PHX13_01500 [Thiovulaceae bacterium]|nr:hypothetical protein [Sulfurimonadaceae bacterium]